MNHVEMMRLAERVTQNSDCADRKVGAVVVLAEGGAISASNTAAWDDTNDNHAESKLVVMAGLMRKSLEGATIYTTCRPCARCTAMLVGRGIKAIYYRDRQPEMGHLQELVKDGAYLNSNWIAGQQPIELDQVQKSWAERSGQDVGLQPPRPWPREDGVPYFRIPPPPPFPDTISIGLSRSFNFAFLKKVMAWLKRSGQDANTTSN